MITHFTDLHIYTPPPHPQHTHTPLNVFRHQYIVKCLCFVLLDLCYNKMATNKMQILHWKMTPFLILAWYYYHIVAVWIVLGINTLRPTQNSRHFADNTFKCIFFNDNLNFEWNFTEICSLWFDWQYDSIGSDNGLAPNRRQAITWTNVGMFYLRINASLGLNELMPVWVGGLLPEGIATTKPNRLVLILTIIWHEWCCSAKMILEHFMPLKCNDITTKLFGNWSFHSIL